MKALTNIWYYFLADSQNRTCSWINGAVVKNNIPTPLPQHPSGWKDIEIKFGTSAKYFAMNRNFSAPLKFINDGANIIRSFAYKGKGYEEDLYILIFKLDRTTGKYKLEYNGRIDFSKINDDPYTGVTVNTLEGGALRYLNANENVTYNIPCDARNSKASKVIFDGITLNATIKYQASKIGYGPGTKVLALTSVSTEGDSAGVIKGDQTFAEIAGEDFNIQTIINNLKNTYSSNYFNEYTELTTVRVFGTFAVAPGHMDANGNVVYAGALYDTIKLAIATRDSVRVLNTVRLNNQQGEFKINIDDTFTYKAGDAATLIVDKIEPSGTWPNLIPTDNFKISVTYQTKQVPSTAYFLRPLDLLKAIVSKMSNGECTAMSNLFSTNNKVVTTCGDALRNINAAVAGIDGYNIKTSFADWFASYNYYNLGIKIIGNVIWVEPKADLFNTSQKIFDLGEVSKFSIEPNTDYIYNSVKVGPPQANYQGLTQNDGKLEFNAQQQWSLPVTVVNKAYDITSKYQTGAYIIEFIRQSLSSGATYNDSDNVVFMVDISDETEQLQTPVDTAISITVNNSPVTPEIFEPANQETVNNNKPFVSGYASINTMVGILIDGTQEGHTTSDAEGYWTYQIQNPLSSLAIDSNGNVITTGKHIIASAYTDGTGTVSGSATLNEVNVIIDTTATANFAIESPANNDALYNNLPIIKGVGPAGTSVELYVDGTYIATTTINNSCHWKYQVAFPLADNTHAITAVNGSNSITVNITVSATTLTYPLITSISIGDTVYTSLPTIKGIANPNQVVTLYLDFITEDNSGNPTNLATVQADWYGNWSVTITTPISDGAHFISTTPTTEQVEVSVSGYKLYREDYSIITGVTDNTIFNRRLSPKYTLLNHSNILRSILYQQPSGKIILTDATKNRNLSTTLNGVTIKESADLVAGALGDPLMLPWRFNLETKLSYTFSEIMKELQAGYITFKVKNITINALPLGEMSCKPASEESQTWKLAAAANNSLETFLQLSGPPLFITTYNKNMISASALCPLHWIEYDYTKDPKYNDVDIHQKLFIERHPSYIARPDYFQKWQKTDTIRPQFITANVGALQITMTYIDGNVIDTFDLTLLNNALIQAPYFLQQVDIPLADYPEGNYVFTLYSEGVPLAYTEWCNIETNQPGTYLIEYSNSYDKLNGYFETWSPMIRVEGLMTPWKPDSDFVDYEDEQKDIELLHAVPSAVRTFIIGNPVGIPDWMALKINEILLLNRVYIDNIRYTRTSDSKMEESTTQGYTMSYYKTTLRKAINDSNFTISDSDLPIPAGGMIVTLDGDAFGKANEVIQITVEKE